MAEIHVYALFVPCTYAIKYFIFELTVLLIRAEVNVDTDLLNVVEYKREITNKTKCMYVQHCVNIYSIIK